jgi:hypothetical protein
VLKYRSGPVHRMPVPPDLAGDSRHGGCALAS